MKKLLYLLFPFFIIFFISCQSEKDFYVRGVSEPLICLNGTWKVCDGSYENILKKDQSSIVWHDIQVPGECMMQGFAIKHDQAFVYATDFFIPADYKEKIINVRFEGVYSYARVWVNGIYIRDHSGGFTAWECDITSAVEPGKTAKMMIEVIDKADEISYASGYAKHQIGGILRNVNLIASPGNSPVLVNISTDFDKNYKDATLVVEGKIRKAEDDCKLMLELYNSAKQKLELNSSEISVDDKEFIIRNLLIEPQKWEAEHPNLYLLKVLFKKQGKVVWQKSYSIGFRDIEVLGNSLLVNGREVKLRGACRHDIHPLLGRLTSAEYDLQDVLLAKEANMNFIRTSHYPPSENFLDLCDKYGIYVEDETAVCFVGSHRTKEYLPGASESSADYTERYLSQLEEMVSNHRNHPSVIIWSIGNENEFGDNFKKSYDWVKSNDPSRPVIFSYPGKVPDSIQSYDIISMHYPGTNGNMEQFGIKTSSFGHKSKPVLFDEWAHVPCYNSETVKEDPNIRDFWGVSLDTMWQKVFEADGGLGGAIWCMIDETFMLPLDLPGFDQWWGKIDKAIIPGNFAGHTIGYGEWGIVDTWRRKKPEFWNVKKAYSPVRILNTENYNYTQGAKVEIPVMNRFDFTNLNELLLTLTVNNASYIITPPDIAPHSKGVITATIEDWPENEPLKLDFVDNMGNLIDSYNLVRARKQAIFSPSSDVGQIDLADNGTEYLITLDKGLKITIDKTKGLFSGFDFGSGIKQFSGPYANIKVLGKEIIYSSYQVNDLCHEWKMNSLSVNKVDNSVKVEINGNYSGIINADYGILVTPGGKITTTYTLSGLPEGVLREAGIKYFLNSDYDSLYWNRKAYWSSYPEGHLSESEATISLFTPDNKSYRNAPAKEWQYDKLSFFYDGTENETDDQLINVARAAKENIYDYILKSKGSETISVKANADRSCRLEKSGDDIILYINDKIDYPDISWGNYSRTITLSDSHSGTTIVVLQE